MKQYKEKAKGRRRSQPNRKREARSTRVLSEVGGKK